MSDDPLVTSADLARLLLRAEEAATRLESANDRAAELIREANGVTKDLIREIKAGRETAEKVVGEYLDNAVETGLKELGDLLRKEMRDNVDKVAAEFAKLGRLYLGTDHESLRAGEVPLVDLLVDYKAAKQRNYNQRQRKRKQ